MKSIASAVVALLVMVAPLQSQSTGTITGQVRDAQTTQPLGSVQVFIAGLDQGVLTQQNGRYLLQDVPAGTHTVTAERIGYRVVTEEVTITGDDVAVLDFGLAEEALQLDEVIVTGTPGGTQRRAIGNAVDQIDASELNEQVAIQNMQQMLTARTPGLQFRRVAGSVGIGSQMQIRGTGSFSLESDPLIYVDGIRVNNESSGGPTISSGSQVNVLDDFNPSEIESIEIIKGPAAATLYGTEASAGVIQIITKKGAEGAAQFDVSVRQGANFLTNVREKVGDAYYCTTSPQPPCAEADLVRYNMYDEANKYISGEVLGPDGQPYFDWPLDQLYQYGHSQTYDVSLRGGSQSARYYLAGNYQSDEGIDWYNHNDVYRLRANVSAVISENWTVDATSSYISGMSRLATPVFAQGGSWTNVKVSFGRCLLRVALDDCPRLGGFYSQRPDDAAGVHATREYTRFTGGVTLNHTFGDWFSQRFIVGIDKSWDQNQNIVPIDQTGQPVYAQGQDGSINFDSPITSNWSFDYAANVEYELNPRWRFTSSVGAQYYIEEFEETSLGGRGFASPLSRTINQTSADRLSLDYDLVENKSLGLYVQEEVSWNDRVFVTGAVRFDDNSAFGADFEAQRYPKVSATWVISEEEFWGIDFINSARLRGAWGKAGRQPDAFAGADVYEVVPGTGGIAAIGPDQPGNPEVGPEVSTEIEVGLDVALMDDRVSGEFTYYHQRNEDALLSQGLPPSVGFPGSVDQNVGRIDNWGWEATVDARLYQGDGVTFDLGVSGDHTMNEIKSLGDFTGSANRRIGYPYPNQVTPYKIVSAELAEPSRPTDIMCDAGVQLGSSDYLDSERGVVPGGEVRPCSEVGTLYPYIGPAFFTYTMSVRPTLGLFGNSLQLFALAEGNFGRWHEDSLTPWRAFFGADKVQWLGMDPIYEAGRLQRGPYRDLTVDEIYPGDFWKMREIGARYQIPESLISRTGAERASISFSGRDLFVIWRKMERIRGIPISDPEHGSGAINLSGNYWDNPPMSSAHVTLRVSF